MPSAYPQRALTVLLLFGTLSAAVALLCSNLIFQLPSGRAAPGVGAAPGAGAGLGALPEPVAAALVPVPAVLAALCLVINVSCFLLCLLHGYFSTELCRGQRAGWFLLHSRSVRHVALGLFCCGLCLYLTALALFSLLQFEPEAGISSACILISAVLLLLLSVLHALLRASQIPKIPKIPQIPLPEPPPARHHNGSAPPRSHPEIHREFSFPFFLEQKSRRGSGSSGSQELSRELSLV
ncbi:transmembrane protein 221 [Catharus ustulatus]|uniref:transmembrane protein 221 n=1 Tax=Catharus ustulatus TaxID=91951 RepID=UPI0014073CA1|nr:transmembrane protein 221 [Catharus ustulatus]